MGRPSMAPGPMVRAAVKAWLLTGARLNSRELRLNGRPLRPRRDGTLPELLPRRHVGLPVRIPPASVAFLQPHGARTAACS